MNLVSMPTLQLRLGFGATSRSHPRTSGPWLTWTCRGTLSGPGRSATPQRMCPIPPSGSKTRWIWPPRSFWWSCPFMTCCAWAGSFSSRISPGQPWSPNGVSNLAQMWTEQLGDTAQPAHKTFKGYRRSRATSRALFTPISSTCRSCPRSRPGVTCISPSTEPFAGSISRSAPTAAFKGRPLSCGS